MKTIKNAVFWRKIITYIIGMILVKKKITESNEK
jgi:hypothetical protein